MQLFGFRARLPMPDTSWAATHGLVTNDNDGLNFVSRQASKSYRMRTTKFVSCIGTLL